KIKELLKPFKSTLRFSFAFRMKDGTMMDVFLEYLNILFMIPFISYHFVFNRIKRNEKGAIKLWQLLGDLEVAYAVLNYRKTLDYYRHPQFNEEKALKGESVYHPLLEDPVSNPVYWERNTLVSGSNASGKSTYVKSVAINCVLAQTIHMVTAKDFSMKRGHVLTSMAVEDDIIMGDSYFIAEIKSLKRILKQVKTKERAYLFIDEILRGTNTVERIAASSSIINWLNDYPSLAFVATHDIELTEMLKNQADNVHFKEEISEDQEIQFHYQLQEGPASSRNAILLLENMNFPESVVENAKERAKFFDQRQEWLNFLEE
ncbi:MAG: DNA mismatch repair protein MutS, partial [Atopostipes suicloacalis]|nr:DNA mismatch repair protein MutS [Atopostipes suicloacalis]